MYPTNKPRFFAQAGTIAMMLTILLASSTAFAGKKGGGGTSTKPPTPTNFRVTAKTAYTVTVAWDAATSSTAFNFHLSGAYHVTPAILPSTARSHTFTALAPGNDYWFFIYTKDATGNAGGQANLGPVLLPRDTTPPWTAPVVAVGEVGANYAHLSWTRAQDDGPYHYSYELWIDGSLLYRSDYPRNVTNTVLRFLEPATSYALQIRTIDFGGNPSPLSAPVTVATPASNPNDTTPPTCPAPCSRMGLVTLSWNCRGGNPPMILTTRKTFGTTSM